MKRPGLLVVVSAPSGTGKTTLCARLLRADRGLSRSISATTRARRPGERANRDYYFITPAEFRRRIRRRAFLEWANVFGFQYGTPEAPVARLRRAGRDVILVIDVQGGLAVKRRLRDAILVFVKPPSYRALAERLRGRGTDSRATIARRLRQARREMAMADFYDYAVVNRHLAQAVGQVKTIIAAERLRRPAIFAKRKLRSH